MITLVNFIGVPVMEDGRVADTNGMRLKINDPLPLNKRRNSMTRGLEKSHELPRNLNITQTDEYRSMRSQLQIYIYPQERVRMPLTRDQLKLLDKRHVPRLVQEEENNTVSMLIESYFIPFPRDGTFAAGSVILDNLHNTAGLVTTNAKKAHFFFIPISCSGLRAVAANRRSGGVLAEMALSHYVLHISHAYEYWNQTLGANHFYMCMHMGASVSAFAHKTVEKNAIAVVCAGDYSNLYFSPHKDIVVPPSVQQQNMKQQTRESSREEKMFPIVPIRTASKIKKTLAFFAGRLDRGRLRPKLTSVYKDDKDILIREHMNPSTYARGLSETKYCLVPRGTKVNSPRVNEVLVYDCVPVIMADFYHLPYTELVEWSTFSIIVPESHVSNLKSILLGVSDKDYECKLENLQRISSMFQYHHHTPHEGDAFFSFLLLLWRKRHIIRYKHPIVEHYS
eukprot:CFRG8603T1